LSLLLVRSNDNHLVNSILWTFSAYGAHDDACWRGGGAWPHGDGPSRGDGDLPRTGTTVSSHQSAQQLVCWVLQLPLNPHRISGIRRKEGS
jgi:hypothetical protein